MTEQESGRGTPRSSPEVRAWETTELLATALGQLPAPARDPAFGTGHAFALADGEGTLTLFPHAVRLTTPDLRLELFRASAPIVGREGVVFEHPGPPAAAFLAVSPTEATLHLVFTPREDISLKSTESTEKPIDPPHRPDVPSAPEVVGYRHRQRRTDRRGRERVTDEIYVTTIIPR
jgi:hypothetical protein